MRKPANERRRVSLPRGGVLLFFALLPSDDMAPIAGGSYIPLLQQITQQDGQPSNKQNTPEQNQPNKPSPPVEVKSFFLDYVAVTNEQFVAFVQGHPEWAPGHAATLLADQQYLKHWDGHVPSGDELRPMRNRPVTYVSWFAAKAYCKAQGKRLPTIAEWEYVAQASEKERDARRDEQFLQRLLGWYSKPTPDILPDVRSTFRNVWGVYDLHGLIWEWVSDFNSAIVTGESRGDTSIERNLFCAAGAVGVSETERINYPAFLRYAFRSSLQGNYAVYNLGFRCARNGLEELK